MIISFWYFLELNWMLSKNFLQSKHIIEKRFSAFSERKLRKFEKKLNEEFLLCLRGFNKRASLLHSMALRMPWQTNFIFRSQFMSKWTTCLNARFVKNEENGFAKWKTNAKHISLNLIYFVFVLILPCKPSHPSIQPFKHSSIHPFIHLSWWTFAKCRSYNIPYCI